MTIHNFKGSLEKSKAQEDAAWWPIVYKKAFPGYLAAASIRNDGWAQRGGIDRLVILKSGKTVYVDEKVRYTSYDDILLERWSSKEAKNLVGFKKTWPATTLLMPLCQTSAVTYFRFYNFVLPGKNTDANGLLTRSLAATASGLFTRKMKGM